ncbi:hypothetical protein JAAARDRAFT_104347, partial [Jaapia argillacea MUCL 33604]
TKFEKVHEQQEYLGSPWGPFEDQEEWELAQWLVRNVGHNQTDKFLKLLIVNLFSPLLLSVQNSLNLSFRRSLTNSFFKKIDTIPTQAALWHCDVVTVAGDRFGEDAKLITEELELWRRDPVECIEELLNNPSFAGHVAFAPERVY